MDYDLNEDQAALVSSLESVITHGWELPVGQRAKPS